MSGQQAQQQQTSAPSGTGVCLLYKVCSNSMYLCKHNISNLQVMSEDQPYQRFGKVSTGAPSSALFAFQGTRACLVVLFGSSDAVPPLIPCFMYIPPLQTLVPHATFATTSPGDGSDDIFDKSSQFLEHLSGWRRRWTIVLLCFVAFMLCNMDRVNMSVAILPMSQQYAWDSKTVGLVQSSFFW